MARCHRIGQTRPVMIYKLCTKGTIDEVIINRAEAKRLLEKVVISKCVQGININSKTDLLKLQKLLQSKECQIVVSKNEGKSLMFLYIIIICIFHMILVIINF